MDDTKVHMGLTAVMRSLIPTNSKQQSGRWCKATLQSLADVEELLDWLENARYEERRLSVVADTFVVRWR